MNIYDMKPIYCTKCGKAIGEIDYDAIVTLPKCGKCANPLPENDDKSAYIRGRYARNVEAIV